MPYFSLASLAVIGVAVIAVMGAGPSVGQQPPSVNIFQTPTVEAEGGTSSGDQRNPEGSGGEYAKVEEHESSARNFSEVSQPLERIENEAADTQDKILNTVDGAVTDSLDAAQDVSATSSEAPIEIIPTTQMAQSGQEDRGGEGALMQEDRPSVEAPKVPTAVERRVLEVQHELADDIKKTLTTSVHDEAEVAKLNVKVDKALSRVESIVKEESGVSVDTSKVKQEIHAQVNSLSNTVKEEKGKLAERGGLAIYRDSDQDGLSDYDETHIYDTNPLKAKSVDGALSDGEKVRLGIDPLSTTTASMTYESPLGASQPTLPIFRVTKVAVTTPAPTSADAGATPKAVTVYGKGLPNSYVTLYIFSTPIIVTVKTDNVGNWSYELDRELPDGSHSMYVAVTDHAGKILARSEQIPFVKQAAAVSFASGISALSPAEPPMGFFEKNLAWIATIVSVLAIVAAFVLLGFVRRKTSAAEVNG